MYVPPSNTIEREQLQGEIARNSQCSGKAIFTFPLHWLGIFTAKTFRAA